MELDFDKEIDALLRRMPKSDADISAANPLLSAHPDADEISAFAENALPEKAKQRLTAHFADCDSCRKNLSELILLNAENEVETIPEKEVAAIAAPLPWYRKLFAFPNLAYTMGALVLAFTGLTAFIMLQSFSGLNSEVARSSNTNSTDRAGRSAPVQSEQMPAASNANSASSNALADYNSAANVSPQSSPEFLSNTSAETKAADRKQMPTESNPSNQPQDKSDLDFNAAEENPSPTVSATVSSPETELKRESPSVAESQPPPKPAAAAAPAKRVEEPKNKKNETRTDRRSGGEKTTDDAANEPVQGASLSRARQISGKTFNQRDGVWYDSAYRNQPTINVRRGTNQYRNLDSGLRSIGNQLDGVVVVIWKTTAYRIQ